MGNSVWEQKPYGEQCKSQEAGESSSENNRPPWATRRALGSTASGEGGTDIDSPIGGSDHVVRPTVRLTVADLATKQVFLTDSDE